MFIRQLSYLVALSRERHFGRAAEACHVSQPALSNAIRRIESELGIAIVNRGHRFEGFTDAGERVLAWARRVLQDCEGLRQEAGSPRDSPIGCLRMGVVPAAVPLAPRLIQDCLRRHPRIRHDLRTLSADAILQRVRHFELDLGLSYLDDERPHDIEQLPLFTERYVLVAGDAAAFAGASAIGWAEVAALPLCLFSADLQCRRGIDAAFANAGCTVQPRLESDSMSTLYAHIRTGGLYSVLPHSVLSLPDPARPLAALAIVPELRRRIGLIVPAGPCHGRVLQAALDSFCQIELQAAIDRLLAGTGHTGSQPVGAAALPA